LKLKDLFKTVYVTVPYAYRGVSTASQISRCTSASLNYGISLCTLAVRANGCILSYQWPVYSVECPLDKYSADNLLLHATSAVSGGVNDYTPAHQTARRAVQSASVSCRAGILTYYIILCAVVHMT